MHVSRRWAVLLALVFAVSHAQTLERAVILPASEAKATTKIYPPPGGKPITGGWQVTPADIAPVEARISEIAHMTPRGWPSQIHIQNPDLYFRQHVGVIQEGKKRIYVNAIRHGNDEGKPPREWCTHFYWVSDGDLNYWQVIYDPETKQFIGLQINPRA
jgi:hypothetical protein